MGYAHQLTISHNHPSWPKGFGQLCVDTSKIQQAAQGLGVFVGGALPGRPSEDHLLTEPIAREGVIDLQGLSPTGADDREHHTGETFWLPGTEPMAAQHVLDLPFRVGSRNGGTFWWCCTTERKPYDLVVTSILLRAWLLMPGAVAISSDGRWDHEWLDGASSEQAHEPQRQDLMGPRRLVAELFDEPALIDPLYVSPLGDEFPLVGQGA